MFMQPFDRLHEICYDIKNSIFNGKADRAMDGRRKERELFGLCVYEESGLCMEGKRGWFGMPDH